MEYKLLSTKHGPRIVLYVCNASLAVKAANHPILQETVVCGVATTTKRDTILSGQLAFQRNTIVAVKNREVLRLVVEV